MNAAALLKTIDQAGISLDLGDNGKLRYSGDQAAIAQWLPEIRTHKAELIEILTTRHRLWLITRPDGSRFSLSRTPPGTRAEIEHDYPCCLVEVESEPTLNTDIERNAS